MGKEVIEKLILVLEKSLIFSQKILYEPLDVITLGTCFSMFVYIHARFNREPKGNWRWNSNFREET